MGKNLAREYDVYIVPGQEAGISFTWTNDSMLPFAPDFRMEIQSGESDWIAGSWITSPMVNAGATSPVIEVKVTVPTNWKYGKGVSFKLKTKLEGFFSDYTLQTWDKPWEIPSITPQDISLVDPVLFQED